MILYAGTIFLGAFLLFLVQPLIGRFILPWFGGGPGVWTTCMLFFQVLLLGGYAYAHLVVRRLRPKSQAILHIGLLLTGLAFLPIVPSEAWKPASGTDPTWRILLLLGACIGMPYAVLSATAPLLQAWLARTHPQRSPYRLYALSNAGSLLALLGYPLVVEPWLPRLTQAQAWSVGYGAFVAMCGYCAVRAGRTPKLPNAETPELGEKSRLTDSNRQSSIVNRQSTGLDRWLWVLLPACASILLLSFTARLSEEIAPMPLLWILPLAVYLLSFIISFEWPRVYHRPTFIALLIGSYGLVWLLMVQQANTAIGLQVAGSLAALFAGCMTCHGEAYRLRPATAHLTSFYLALALGGAAGGAFVSLAAPHLFSFPLEFYLALFGSFGLLLACLWHDPRSIFHRGARRPVWLALIALVLLAAYGMQAKHAQANRRTLARVRNFFGVLSLIEQNGPPGDELVYVLRHGRIIHGAQIMSPDWLGWPTTYYGPTTGLGQVVQFFPKQGPRRIGVVGLGAGTLAAYGRSGDVIRFYEINPAAADLARDPFLFLESSPAKVEVVMGDARLSLEREPDQAFDMLVLDAFSGDAVPTHLLTREAFAIYRRHVRADGAILVHVSNVHLDLHLALMRQAEDMGWQGRLMATEEDTKTLTYAAEWMILTPNQALLEEPRIKSIALQPRENVQRVDLWTDDHVNLLQILK